MTLVQLFQDQARAAPAAPALIWNHAHWSYAELARAQAAAAAGLAARGLVRGDRVALLLRNSPQYAAALYGTLAAGGVAVALNALERAEVLARQVAHSGARVLVIDPAHLEYARLRGLCDGQGVQFVEVATQDSAEGLAAFIAAWGEAPVIASIGLSDQDPALLIYTSGTTGRPKAVMLGHGNLASNARAIVRYLELNARDRGFCVLPFHFSYGNSVLTSHLSCGAALIIEDNLAFPQRSMQRMAALGATGFAGVPSTFTLLLQRGGLAEYDFSALRYVTQAGGAMTRTAIARLRQELPRARVFVMYGQTEATARISYLPPESLDAKLGSVGLPIAGTRIEICDAAGQPLPADSIGEVRVQGPGVMLGYWQDAAATREVLRDGWLCTGDLGHKDADGFLYVDGRTVEMIKVGAFRVSPYEVEEAIALLDGVEEVAVGAMPDEVLGQAIKAVIVLRSGAQLDALAVKAHCRQALATYKIPKTVEFAAQLPRTLTGKVQRLQLNETH
jgi:long-chain acyl-CoA synthetase